MAEYYVVRDKNTGLYFRGKGVNRWGKYYNQASIYRIKANAENTIKEVSWRGEQAEIVPIQIVETTADVVPKSEVENLIYKLECLLCHSTGGMLSKYSYDFQTMESAVTDYINKVYYEGYDEAKAEVAREIFEEIERLLDNYHSMPIAYYDVMLEDAIAELKKKYTEESDG